MPRVIHDMSRREVPGFIRERNSQAVLLLLLALVASSTLSFYSHPVLGVGLFAGLGHRIWLFSQRRLPARNWQ